MPSVNAPHGPIEYVVDGPETGRPIVVVVGLTAQLVRFPPGLVRGLVENGFRVVRLDNRDAGKSKHYDEAGMPDMAAVQAAVKAGQKPPVPYTLDDMAGDVLAVMDALGIARSDFIGVSMGGYIVQLIAADHPERVRSLTLMMTSTGNPALPASDPEVQKAMGGLAGAAQKGADALVAHGLEAFKLLATPTYPMDPAKVEKALRVEHERGFTTPAGAARQRAATLASGDRRAKLATIRVPTAVLHGDADKVLPLACGEDVAKSIPGATLRVFPDMAHGLVEPLVPEYLAEILKITQQAT